MTAITVGTTTGSAFIITDAGEVDERDRLTAIRSKVFRAPGLSLAIAYEGLGNVDFIQRFFQDRGFETQAQAMRAIPELSRAMLAAGMKEHPGEFEPMRHGHRLYVLAYRPDAGPIVAACGTDQLSWGPSYQPFSLIPLPGYANMSVQAHSTLRNAGDALSSIAWTILEQQRAGPWPDGKVAVRGFGELVTVGSDGVHSEIVGRWEEDWQLLHDSTTTKARASWWPRLRKKS